MTFFQVAIRDSLNSVLWLQYPSHVTPTVIIEILIEKLTGVRFQHSLSRGIQILLLMETAFLPEEQHELSVCTNRTQGYTHRGGSIIHPSDKYIMSAVSLKGKSMLSNRLPFFLYFCFLRIFFFQCSKCFTHITISGYICTNIKKKFHTCRQ